MLDNEEITHFESHSASFPFIRLSQYTHIQLFNSDSRTKSFPLLPSSPTTVQCQHISQLQIKKVQYVFSRQGKLLLEIGLWLGNHYVKSRQKSFRRVFNRNCTISPVIYGTSWLSFRLSSHYKKPICPLQCIKKKNRITKCVQTLVVESDKHLKILWCLNHCFRQFNYVLFRKNRSNIRVSECPHFLFILITAIKICFETEAKRQKTIAMFSPYFLR